jgi:hypothetical protein
MLYAFSDVLYFKERANHQADTARHYIPDVPIRDAKSF